MSSSPVRLLRPLVVAVAGFALFASAGSARADMISFSGNTNAAPTTTVGYDPVSFSGTVTVTGSGTTSATVSIMLKNTTSIGDAVQKGYITGFGFNLGTNLVVKSGSASSTDADFKFLTPSSTVSTYLQGANNDYAFSLSSKELHTVDRGAPNTALIATGLGANPQQSSTFTFTVTNTGGGVVNLNAADIVNDKSGSGYTLSVRFRSTDVTKYKGHNDPDGDKVAASVDAPKPNGVPAPPGLVLAGVGFGCVLLGRFRRK